MAKTTKTQYRTVHPVTGEEVTFTKGGRAILWATWADFGKGLVRLGYSSATHHKGAISAAKSTNRYAGSYAATPVEVVTEAPAVTAVALPVGVTMDETTRVLSGPIKHMKALYESGTAVIRDGDLVLI